MSAQQSDSGDGSRDSGGSNSDASKSDASKSGSADGSSDGASDTNSESGGSSDSNSETSGTVTTRGQNANAADSSAVLVTTGLLLLGATLAGTTAGIWFTGRTAMLEAHRRDIRIELARGQGRFVDEIAAHLGLASVEMAVLGRVLKDARASLDVYLAEPKPLTDVEADAFLTALVGALRAEATFAARVDAIIADVGAEVRAERAADPR